MDLCHIAELDPYYRWNNGEYNIDFLAGIVYSQVETDAKLSTLPSDISVSEDWVDPYIGVSSDFIWEGAALLSWQPLKYAQILAGYRAVGTDYETESGLSKFVYDVTLSGPVLGINFSW